MAEKKNGVLERVKSVAVAAGVGLVSGISKPAGALLDLVDWGISKIYGAKLGLRNGECLRFSKYHKLGTEGSCRHQEGMDASLKMTLGVSPTPMSVTFFGDEGKRAKTDKKCASVLTMYLSPEDLLPIFLSQVRLFESGWLMGVSHRVRMGEREDRSLGMGRMISDMQEKLKEFGADRMLNAARAKLKEMGADSLLNSAGAKLKELLLVPLNFVGQLIDWFDEAFLPETRRGQLRHWILVGAAAIATGLVLLDLLSHCSSGKQVKMMKAPGRNFRIPRKDFAASPKLYFRNLHAMKKRN